MDVFVAQSHVEMFLFQGSHGVLIFCCVNSFLVCGLLMQEKKHNGPFGVPVVIHINPMSVHVK